MNDVLWLLAAGSFAWWAYKKPAALQTPANGGSPAVDPLLPAKRALRAFLAANYTVPPGTALATVLTGANFAVHADQLPADPPFAAGTIKLIDNAGRSQLDALAVAAGARVIPITVTDGAQSTTAATADALAQLARMQALLASLPLATPEQITVWRTGLTDQQYAAGMTLPPIVDGAPWGVPHYRLLPAARAAEFDRLRLVAPHLNEV